MPQFIYDIIPPEVKRRVAAAAQEVSKWIRFLRIFLKTSKYGTAFLIIGILGFGALLVFAFYPSGEKIEIFPTKYKVETWSEEITSESYETGWQNGEKALQGELDEEAGLAEFSSENSAVLFEEIPLDTEGLTGQVSSESESAESPEDIQAGPPASTQRGEPRFEDLGGEEISSESLNEEELASESEFVEEIIEQEMLEEPIEASESEEIPEGIGGCEFCEEEELASDAEDLLDLLEETEEIATISQPPIIRHSIIFSGFEYTTSESFNSFKKAKLMLSWANKERQGNDALLVEYKTNNSQIASEGWKTLGIIQLNKEHSNLLDKGYWGKEISDIDSWMTLKDLEIKITIQSFNIEDKSSIFIDAVWFSMEKVRLDEDRDLKKTHSLENISEKKSFKKGEDLEFEFNFKKTENKRILGLFSSSEKANVKGISIKATVVDNNDQALEEIDSLIDYGEDGQFIVTIDKSDFYKLRPGKYKLKIEIENEEGVFVEEQDFTWGVLAINTNKSIYLPGEQAYLQMAALDDSGHTICNANLRLEIIYPNGQMIYPEVQRSGKCSRDNVTDVPDYFVYYQVGDAGVYEMKLINLDNGYEINDSFEVRDSVPFEIERIGPTRIYPPEPYTMKFKIKANEDFQGNIIEQLPVNFEIITGTSTGREKYQETQQIIWRNVVLQAGDEIELEYQFDAPDISPYLYSLGPLMFINQKKVFEEFRQWQIVSDAPDTLDSESFEIVDSDGPWNDDANAWEYANTATGDDCNWRQLSGDVPSHGYSTGPGGASNGTYYVYIETSSGQDCAGAATPKTAFLLGPDSLDADTYAISVDFDYCMFGATVNTLYFEVTDDGGSSWDPVWSLSSNQGDQWWAASTIDLSSYSGTIGVRFRALSGTSYTSDIAIDHVVITGELKNSAPDAPDIAETPAFANMETDDTTPVFGNFSSNDSDTNDVEFEINWDTDPDFTPPVLASQSSADYVSNGFTAATFGSGATTSYQIQAGEALTNGQTYWWRVRARDPSGSNTWGEYSESRSITIDTSLTKNQWLQTTYAQLNTNTLSDTVASISTDAIAIPTAGGSDTVTFTTPGSDTWDVPAGVTSITVKTWGAGGGGGGAGITTGDGVGGDGGGGGFAAATITVTPSETLNIYIGGAGGGGGGATTQSGGGGGGGGFTGVKRGATELVVAGGGGGGGGGDNSSATAGGAGGVGGGSTGGTGSSSGSSTGGAGGQQGTGGAYGSGTTNGSVGTADQGGAGADGNSNPNGAAGGAGGSQGGGAGGGENTSGYAGGGGGGGGIYGGGGGGDSTASNAGGGGGGGGPNTLTGTGQTNTQAVGSTGAGQGDSDYPGGVGDGGAGGPLNANPGSTGEPGAVVIIYTSVQAEVGTATSTEVDFNWVSGESSWGEVYWSTDETAAGSNIKLYVYYDPDETEKTEDCDTIVPDEVLPGNSSGFDVAASPLDISDLTPATYNRICLKASLSWGDSESPLLNDWKITWEPPTAGNQPPSIGEVSLNGKGTITLIENTTIDIMASASVTDADGCDDISGVKAILYRYSTYTASCSDDPNNCYDEDHFTCVTDGACSGNTQSFNCFASSSMQFFADPTDAGSSFSSDEWVVSVIASDSEWHDVSSHSYDDNDESDIEVNTLVALEIVTGDPINYGTVVAGQDTDSTNQTVTVKNTGNRGMDVNLSGTNLTGACGTIDATYQEYNDTTPFGWGSGTDLTDSNVRFMNGSVSWIKPTSATPVTNDIYWGIGVPAGVQAGSCSGTNTFSAAAEE